MIRIRKATLKDVSLIVDLWKEFMKVHDKIVLQKNKKLVPYNKRLNNAHLIYKKFVAENLTSGKGAVFIAEVDKEVAGYSLIFIKDNIPVFELKRYGYFSDLYVRKEFRRKGISSQLVKRGIKWFKKKGIKHVSIALYSDNEYAHSIYKKWGFFDYHVDMRKKI